MNIRVAFSWMMIFSLLLAGLTTTPAQTAELLNENGAIDLIPRLLTIRSSVNPSPLGASVPVGGSILTHTTWISSNVYVVNNNIGIASGITLTIEPGTVISFTGNYTLTVGGTLFADGEAAHPITFTARPGLAWSRIYFNDSSVDATADAAGVFQSGNLLRHVRVEGAVSGIGCINVTPYLDHVTLTGGGIDCTGGDTPLWIKDSDLSGDVQISEGSRVDSLLGTWRARPDMPTVRSYAGTVTASNGRIYVIGGWNWGPLATTEEYNPATDTWTTRTPMPTARGLSGVVAASNGKIYVIGGLQAEGVASSAVEEYDPATDTWTTRASMPTTRCNLAAAMAPNGRIYAIGGSNGPNILAVVEEYDPLTDAWTPRTPMPTSRRNLAVVAAPNGRLYAIGGTGSANANLPTVEEYNPAADTWIPRASMPTGRLGMGVALASNGNIYVIGGSVNDGTSGIATVEEYNPVLDIWMSRASMPTARTGPGVAVAPDGQLYAVGGHTVWEYPLATVEEFTLAPESYGYHILSNHLRGNLSLPQQAEARDNILSGGGISAGTGSVLHHNTIEGASGWGIDASGCITIEHNRLIGNANGIRADRGTLQGNLIANSGGVGLQLSGNATVISNTLTGNAGNAIIIASGTPVLTANNLELNHGAYDVVNNTTNAIAAAGNWWGTTDAATIESRIYDLVDDFNLGQVAYTPALTGPVQDAPAYVRSVTISPNPAGLGPTTFDVAFSRPMDTAIDPQMTFAPTKNDVWTVRTSMPTSWGLGAITTSNGKIYIIGNDKVDEYDPAMDTWSTKTGMLTLRGGLGAATANNGKIYLIGGTDNGGVSALSTVEEYDPATDTWATKASMPTARWGLSVVAASNGKIYAIGGYNEVYLPTVEEYDPSTNTWTTRANMPTRRRGMGVAVTGDGKIYAIGGEHEFSYLATVEEYNPFLDTWATKASMPTARVWVGAATANNGKIYAIGGASGEASVEEYNPATNTWVIKPNLYKGRYGIGVARADNGKIYAIGGYDGRYYLTRVDEYTPPGWGTQPLIGSPEWLDPTHFRTSCDITPLVPHGTYTLTIFGASSSDGFEIAPASNFTFTVSYPTVRFDAAAYSVSESAGTATMTVTLDISPTQVVTIPYTTIDHTAIAGIDYVTTTGALTFTPGLTLTTFAVPILDDALDESDKALTVTLGNPISVAVGIPGVAVLTIMDDDPPPEVQFSAAVYSADESGGAASITVTLSGASTFTVTVDYATSDGTATAGSDYTAIGGALTFAPGQTVQTFKIPVLDDALDETDETLTMTLSNPDNATLGTPNPATLTLLDDDDPPTAQFSAAAYSVGESAGTVSLTVTLSAVSGKTVTVDYATSDGTATAGSDYIAIGGALTFAPGQTVQTFEIPVLDDALDETDETLTMTLSNPDNATLGTPNPATLTLLDDDDPPTAQFSAAAYSADESAGTILITVTLSAVSGKTVTVDYATSDGTTTAGSDYTAASGALTFAPGQTVQTFEIAVLDDALDETDETLTATLSNPDNATLGMPNPATLTLLDDDGPEVAFGATGYSVNEGDGYAVISVTLSYASVQTVTVAYATNNGTATAGNDYILTEGKLTFAPGDQISTFSVPISDDDTLLEPDETLTLVLSDPSRATLGTPITATLTIVENDLNVPPVEIVAPPDPSQPVTVSINTPAGVVEIVLEDVRAGGTITALVSVTPPNQPPSNFTLLGIHYEVTISGIDFAQATIRFPYRDSDVVAAGVAEESLRLLHFEDGHWKDITTDLDTSANIITGVTEDFSLFVIGVQNMQGCAISLNSGAAYTGRLNVQVFSNMPDAAEMLVSNDAGFTGAQWRPYHSALDWIITNPGDRIVTLLVYVRFRDINGNLLCSGLSLNDDIIYDPLAPSIISVIIQPGQMDALTMPASDTITLQLSAADQQGGSGIADMQIGADANFTGARWQPFNTTAQAIAQPGDEVYARVRDGVGNVSAAAMIHITGRFYVYLPLVVR